MAGFCEAQAKVLAAGVSSPADWAPMAKFLAVKEFKRVGAYLEELDYAEYCKFLTKWAAGGTRFEMTEFHTTEVGNTVFQEIEERHFRGDTFIRKNVIAAGGHTMRRLRRCVRVPSSCDPSRARNCLASEARRGRLSR